MAKGGSIPETPLESKILQVNIEISAKFRPP